jgi:hypothetical protein
VEILPRVVSREVVCAKTAAQRVRNGSEKKGERCGAVNIAKSARPLRPCSGTQLCRRQPKNIERRLTDEDWEPVPEESAGENHEEKADGQHERQQNDCWWTALACILYREQRTGLLLSPAVAMTAKTDGSGRREERKTRDSPSPPWCNSPKERLSRVSIYRHLQFTCSLGFLCN